MLQLDSILNNKTNRSVVRYLQSQKYPFALKFLTSDETIEAEKQNIGTLPDIVNFLWHDYAQNELKKCKVILFGKPILVNPNTGIIFGFAEGTNPPLLRLPNPEILKLLKEGGKIKLFDMDGEYANAKDFGNEWIFCFSFIANLEQYFLDAYRFSAEQHTS